MDQGRTIRALALGMALLFGNAFAGAQSLLPYHEAGGWIGRSFKLFGSHEIRNSVAGFYGFAKPDRRLKHGPVGGHVVYEGYAEFNDNPGDAEVQNSYHSEAVGGLAMCRWDYKSLFVDFGIGLQVQDRLSPDLPSYVNTTPTLGLGWVLKSGDRPTVLGLRYLHTSNAHTHRKNAGQNQLLLYLSVLSY